MANKKITELPELFYCGNEDLMIIESAEGTHKMTVNTMLQPIDFKIQEKASQYYVENSINNLANSNTALSNKLDREVAGLKEVINAISFDYPAELEQTVIRNIGGFKKGDSLTGMKLEEILEKLLCYAPPAPTFVGMINYKPRKEITFEDLNSDSRVKKDIATKPQTIYNNPNGFVTQIAIVLAVPKTFGTITGVVDGANVSIEGAYSWEDVVLQVPDVGPVEYCICSPDEVQMANSGTTVKWNME